MKDKIIITVLIAIIVILVGYGLYYYLVNFDDTPNGLEMGRETINIYFNNEELNPDAQDCGAVFPVGRTVLKPVATPKTALQELFKGPKESEEALGYNSWFSEETADILRDIKVEDKTAYVNLEDIRDIIPGASASCGSQQLLAEIETTLKQFSSVDRVIIAIDGHPATFYEWIQIGCSEENDFCDEAPFQESEEKEEEEPNFSTTGNLTINTPGAKPNVWYLIYDQPGSPGVKEELRFGPNTLCYVGEVEMACAVLDEDITGVRATVTGFEEDDVVLVKTLVIIDQEGSDDYLENLTNQAKNWIEANAPTYVFDGMALTFEEIRGLDLVDCENCYEVEFSFNSRQAGYGDRTDGASAQVITSHTIVVFIEDGDVTRVITDGVYDEINEEMIDN